MATSNLFRFSRKSLPLRSQHAVSAGLDSEKAAYIAGLIANLLNRAAATGGFRGAIPAHPHIAEASATLECDEGRRPDFGLHATATRTEARLTVSGIEALRLGFLAFAPLHKQELGYEPLWHFDDPDAAMMAHATIIGVTFDVRCTENTDGTATVSLALVGLS